MQLSRLRRRLGEERGQSLVELLVAMVVGSIVLIGVTEVTVTTLQTTARTQDRVESQQQARVVIDRALVTLNSQTCPATGQTWPIVEGSTASQISFYYDNASVSGASNVKADRMTYYPAQQRLVEERFPGPAFTGTPRQIVSTGIVAPTDGPFSYYTYNGDATDPQPTARVVLGPSGLTADQAQQVVRVRVDLTAATRRTNRVDGRSTAVSGDAYLQFADPNAQDGDSAACRGQF